MIGQVVTDDKGMPLGNGAKSLTLSQYNPPQEVKQLFMKVQTDYQSAYALHHKPLDDFDGHDLLQRAKLDQETFAAFVGLEYLPRHKQWRWRGRKNTARNKLIGILAHMIAGMLFPYVFAQNEQDEEDKMTARAMKILVEEKLRKAGYEIKFFYSVLCALVNPAVIVEVEYAEILTNIRQKVKDGYKLRQVVDEAVSGLLLHIVPIDEILFGDFYCGTANIPGQPYIIRQRRIPYDLAKGKYQGKYFYNGKDLFDYVQAGKTHWMASDQNLTLFDVEYDDADANMVHEMTIYYKSEDLQLTWVGGIGMFDHSKPYDNPFEHRRMVYQEGEWFTIPVYRFAMSGFEPIDPQGRFLWFKSGAFKEFWEDKKITELDRMLIDGIKLDIFKPMFVSGVAKVDQAVMVPGATIGMPANAKVEAYSLGPNLVAAFNAITEANTDMSESTQDKIMQGVTEKGITATQTNEARQNARIFLGVFGFMVANLVKQIGELTVDCVIQYDTVGDLEESLPGSLRMKYKSFLAKGKEKGQDINNKIIFTSDLVGRKMTDKDKNRKEWDLYHQSGGEESDQRLWLINPYRFARTRYSMYIDADKIVQKSMGTDDMEKDMAFEKLMDPRILPFVDPEAVAEDFVIERYSNGDPTRYKRKEGQDEMIQALLGQAEGRTPLTEPSLTQ